MAAEERNKPLREGTGGPGVRGATGEHEEGMGVENGDENGVTRGKTLRRFPVVSTLPRLPVAIADEILDYYGWLFCQGGFSNLNMTFEQFLAVVAAVSPSGLSPEYADSAGVPGE